MSRSYGPDWRAIAAAQKLELSDTAVARLEGLAKTMLGLRGLIDWGEDPAVQFSLDAAEEEEAAQ